MSFSDSIKKEVRQKAGYKCCRCQSIGVEVHHIIPQGYNGPDTIDNAAPLCPNCHTDFGSNPEKRKVITEMRDWWYGRVGQMYGSNSRDLNLLKEIYEKVESVQKSHSDISELKTLLKDFADRSIDNLTPANAMKTASNVTSTTMLGDKVHANFKCSNCGTQVGLLIGTNVCPKCKTPIN